MNNILFTCGDVNGIGPEIIIKTLNSITRNSNNSFFVICPRKTFLETSQLVKPLFNFSFTNKYEPPKKEVVSIITLKNISHKFGYPTILSGRTAYNAIKLAIDLSNLGKIDAIITAPISKTAFNMARVKFPGHTEMLGKFTNTKNFLMMFLSRKMKAAIVTIHEPVKNVSELINKNILYKTFDVVIDALKNDFNMEAPKIAVLGLNPHAGENGVIGTEENKIIAPAIKDHKFNNLLYGPFSPDAFFANKSYKNFDIIIGMYHDQILIPFKLLNFGGGVNYTAGLPLVRTSPDHGVAYDIAGKNLADPSSMIQAYHYADRIVKNRKKNV